MSNDGIDTDARLEPDVRPASEPDLPALKGLELADEPTRLDFGDLERTLDLQGSGNGMLLVGMVGGKPAGYVAGYRPEGVSYWRLRRLLVARAVRGRGVGRALCAAFLRRVDEQERECHAFVPSVPHPVRELLASLGFRFVHGHVGIPRMHRPPRG